eukprot:CAMPEP_0183702652 /NCGR_PEP_ID=MMETSP0737-20130205/690_1 /TAXON_ID=385413 /ORGANISM="Thalassiosira miniscula, Strain CCMP1093" /LENGTH=193 /DNA_ID=CAMNT_0025929299 /DNA_START=35 /DNA_END=616 /DNA_ORIENTATION=+
MAMVSLLRRPSRMASSRLFLATIALSSSWTPPLVESFAMKSKQNQKTPGLVLVHHRNIHLPTRNVRPVASSASEDGNDTHQSVTGPIYEMDGAPTVKLFTKQGCTLCDKVKDVLDSVRDDQPHSLYAVDITDDDKQEWFSKYKYDIPVLHVNDIYWAKHRLSAEEAIAGIEEACKGSFEMRQGEPDASRLEHN